MSATNSGDTPTTPKTPTYGDSPMEISAVYQYEALDTTIDSIRLLILEPWDGNPGSDDTVYCKLVSTTFRAKPKYEALSYTWGEDDPKQSKLVVIDGMTKVVRENLYNALYYLRLKSETRLLWADAICIDQLNLQERAYQVSLMDYIYTRARVVLVWLGCRPLTTKRRNGLRHFPSINGVDYAAWIEWLRHLDYWNRLWVIQEIVLAPQLYVCIERESIPWRAFVHRFPKEAFGARLSSHVTAYAEYEVLRGLIIKLNSKRLDHHGSQNKLEMLLIDFQYAQCRDPRDKVYGLLGLAHDCQDGSITADYTKPTYQLYSDVMNFLFRKRLPTTEISTLYDRSKRAISFSQCLQRNLGKDCVIPASHSAGRRRFRIRGAVAGSIVHLGPSWEEFISSGSVFRSWRAAFYQQFPTGDTVQRLREANDAYLETVLAMTEDDFEKLRSFGCSEDVNNSVSFALTHGEGPWVQGARKWVVSEPTGVDYRLESCRKEATRLENAKNGNSVIKPSRLEGPCPQRDQPRLILTSDGFIGLAPADTEIGDFICHFSETNVVALLRPNPTGRYYRIAGRVDLCTSSHRDIGPQPWNAPPIGASCVVSDVDLHTLQLLTC